MFLDGREQQKQSWLGAIADDIKERFGAATFLES
jgi:hypothetical protein